MSSIMWPDENPTQFHLEELNQFLIWSFKRGCSEVFVDSEYPLAVRYNGFLSEVSSRCIPHKEVSTLINDIFNPSATDLIRDGQPAVFCHALKTFDGTDVRFRVHASAGRSFKEPDKTHDVAIRMVFRVRDKDSAFIAQSSAHPAIMGNPCVPNDITIFIGTDNSTASILAGLIQRELKRQDQSTLTERPSESITPLNSALEGLCSVDQPSAVPSVDSKRESTTGKALAIMFGRKLINIFSVAVVSIGLLIFSSFCIALLDLNLSPKQPLTLIDYLTQSIARPPQSEDIWQSPNNNGAASVHHANVRKFTFESEFNRSNELVSAIPLSSTSSHEEE